jgi:flagellar motor switch protein FliN
MSGEEIAEEQQLQPAAEEAELSAEEGEQEPPTGEDVDPTPEEGTTEAVSGEEMAEDTPVTEEATPAEGEEEAAEIAPVAEEAPPVEGEEQPTGETADSTSPEAIQAVSETTPEVEENVPPAEEAAPVDPATATDPKEDPAWPIHEKAITMLKEVKFVAAASRKAHGVDVGTLNVLLTFELGSTHLTMKDLESMREGYVLTLDRPNDEFVNIRANGHLIGHGRIVSVDGRIGIQVEELNS